MAPMSMRPSTRRGCPARSIVVVLAALRPALMAGEQMARATEVGLTKGETVTVRLLVAE